MDRTDPTQNERVTIGAFVSRPEREHTSRTYQTVVDEMKGFGGNLLRTGVVPKAREPNSA